MRSAQAFHLILFQSAVVLKNRIEQNLSTRFGYMDWMIIQPPIFTSPNKKISAAISSCQNNYFFNLCINMKKKLPAAPDPNQLYGTKHLIISENKEKPLTPEQKKFNTLVKKIATLQREIKSKIEQLDESLEYYAGNIHPLEKSLTALRKRFVLLIYPWFKKPEISAKDKKMLRFLLNNNLDSILTHEEMPSDELKEIFEDLEGKSLNEAKQETIDEMLQDLQAMADSMGFVINVGEIDASADDEDIEQKINEIHLKMRAEAEKQDEKKQKRKKTAKQTEKAEKQKQKEEISKKTISSIYKQLAKVLHPDLEQDPAIKKLKEVKMQKLTAAYEQGDLHTLLKLEIEWISKEGDDIERLSNEKLTIYNKLLSEQIAELEMESWSILNHPRYSPLKRYGAVHLFAIKNMERNLTAKFDDLTKTVEVLDSADAAREIKSLIKMAKGYVREY